MRSLRLNPPDHYGTMTTDEPLHLKDAIINEYIAIVFELSYILQVQSKQIHLILGYQAHMPDINSINKIEETELDAKLIHGPTESLSGDLIVAGGVVRINKDDLLQQDQSGIVSKFDFAIRAWIS